MANIEYIIPGSGIVNDTESGQESIIPGVGIYNEQSGGGAVASATLTGTAITGGVLESEIVAGGETIIITLTNDTWVAAGTTFNDQRQNIINGLVAASSPTYGWNNVVKAGLDVSAVVRTSNTVVTITL